MRIAPPLLLALLLGCGSSPSDAAPPSAPSPAPPPPPAADCAIELATDAGWTQRDTMSCQDDRIDLLLTGDIGRPGGILGATVQGAASYCAQRGCGLGLAPGDIIYGDGTLAESTWRAVWDEGLATLGIPFVAVLGNHEYRHEPNSELKRAALLASDGRARLIAPGSSYALRVTRGGRTLLAIAAVDTDSIANPGPEMPGLGGAALDAACALDVPTVWVGHHPPSSQGLHHTHEAHVETALRTELAERVAGGCNLVLAVAGHDHDLQAYGPGCEQAGVPGVLVSGPAAKGYRAGGPPHLSPCTADADAVSLYHAGPKETGGFAHARIDPSTGLVEIELLEALGGGATQVLSSAAWTSPPPPRTP